MASQHYEVPTAEWEATQAPSYYRYRTPDSL